MEKEKTSFTLLAAFYAVTMEPIDSLNFLSQNLKVGEQ